MYLGTQMIVENLRIARRILVIALFMALSILCLSPPGVNAQGAKTRIEQKPNPKANREFGLAMLRLVKKVLKDNYYDPTFHGINIDERFKAAEAEIKTEDRRWQINRTIAQILLDLNDSHTAYYPPEKLFSVDYGFSMMMMGGSCYVVNVKKHSNAETKGITPGDEIVEINGLDPKKDSLWVIYYIINRLDPQDNLNIKLRKLDNTIQEITVEAKFLSQDEQEKQFKEMKNDNQIKPYACSEISQELIACKLRTFVAEGAVIDKMMKEVGVHKKFILDLRGNRGGIVDTEERLTGYFFDHDVKIFTERRRNGTKDKIAKSHGDKAFGGEVSVLIDSRSASASEIFARVIQIEKRGKIIGDVSDGAVMESYQIPLSPDFYDYWTRFTVAEMSVTIADLIMSDGGRLEGKGVIPDVPVFPNRVALSKRLDPVLAYAAQLMGSPISAQKAGDLHFLIPKEVDPSSNESDKKKKKDQ